MSNNYLQEIESKFCQIRGKGLMISGADFQLVHSWESLGIPLRLVLSAMEDVHKTFKSQRRPGNINSLSYFKQAVDIAFADFQKSQVGKNQPGPQPGPQSDPYQEMSDFICKTCKFFNCEPGADFYNGWCESDPLNDEYKKVEENFYIDEYTEIATARELCNPETDIEFPDSFTFYQPK